MKITDTHRTTASAAINSGSKMKDVQERLMAEGLSKSQAHDVAARERKKLGKYKPKSGWEYQ